MVKESSGDLPEEIEECRRHYELIEEMCRDIRTNINSDVRKVFQKQLRIWTRN